MGRYTKATTEAREITTRLRMDADDIDDKLRAVIDLLSGNDITDTVEQLQRLWRDERDGVALKRLERLEALTYQLSQVATHASQGGIEFVVADDFITPSGRENYIARTTLRYIDGPEDSTVVPEGFFEEPTNID